MDQTPAARPRPARVPDLLLLALSAGLVVAAWLPDGVAVLVLPPALVAAGIVGRRRLGDVATRGDGVKVFRPSPTPVMRALVSGLLATVLAAVVLELAAHLLVRWLPQVAADLRLVAVVGGGALVVGQTVAGLAALLRPRVEVGPRATTIVGLLRQRTVPWDDIAQVNVLPVPGAPVAGAVHDLVLREGGRLDVRLSAVVSPRRLPALNDAVLALAERHCVPVVRRQSRLVAAPPALRIPLGRLVLR